MRAVILGAGLAGLTVAYLLREEDVDVTILEARDRIGGRIWTRRIANDTPVEAGATWFGAKHEYLVRLLEELGIDHFEQFVEGISLFETMSFAPPQQFRVPAEEPPSYRILGGSSALIDALAATLDPSIVHLNDPVASLSFVKAGCSVATKGRRSYSADVVISTLPPRLFEHGLKVSPALPEKWVELARLTHTWMADSIKFFVSYKKRFWTERSFSGMVYSQSSIIPEMYDHSSGEKYALKGFLAGHAYKLNPEERQKAVIDQLVKYFGSDANDVLEYGDVLWRDEPYTRAEGLEDLFPHQNNGHESLRMPLYEGRLWHAGSETADAFPGYMDGAVNAAYRVVARLKASSI